MGNPLSSQGFIGAANYGRKLLWEQEVPGSNPGAPTDVSGCQYCIYRRLLYEILGMGLHVTLHVRDVIPGVWTPASMRDGDATLLCRPVNWRSLVQRELIPPDTKRQCRDPP